MPTTTTTIRIDRDVHRRLVALSRHSGQQLMDVVRDAAEALERSRLAASVMQEIDVLRHDQQAWSAYVSDAELSVDDGLA